MSVTRLAFRIVWHWICAGFFTGTGAMLAYAFYAEFWGRYFPGLHKIATGVW